MAYQKQKGFTIVELLIVIVVIGILAAITIVAYNGIQDRARVSAVSGALTQTVSKLEVYAVDGTGYPTTLAAAGVNDTASTTYQYSVNNGVSPATYCVTATTGTTSYKVSSTNTTPTAGGCSGHGQGGVAAITNIVTNPSVETNMTAWVASYGAGGGGTLSSASAGGAQAGNNFARMTWTVGATEAYRGLEYGAPAIAANATYTGSISVRTSRSQRMYLCFLYADASAGVSQPCGNAVVTTAGAWTRLDVTAAAPATAIKVYLRAYAIAGAGASNWQVNDALDGDAAMITAGSTLYNYADGASTNWVWNGTPHSSTSTGPPL